MLKKVLALALGATIAVAVVLAVFLMNTRAELRSTQLRLGAAKAMPTMGRPERQPLNSVLRTQRATRDWTPPVPEGDWASPPLNLYTEKPARIDLIKLPPVSPYLPSRVVTDYKQVGFVYDEERTVRAPLFGRRAPRDPRRWQYFVRTPEGDVRIGVRRGGMPCLTDTGCDELVTGDDVIVPELLDWRNGTCKAQMYEIYR